VLLGLGYLTSRTCSPRCNYFGWAIGTRTILALRHQIAVLERQLGQRRVRFTAADRALLAALLHRLPRQAL
jgi:hypothetical protein